MKNDCDVTQHEMVQLTAVRKEIDPKTGKPKLPWWHLSKFAKINICM